MRKVKSKNIPERLNPGDLEPLRCAPGSIEQKLDMCESGDLRGDEIEFHHGLDEQPETDEPKGWDEILYSYNVDMSEENREGADLSGDEHSSGAQGDQAEVLEEEHA